MTAVPTTTTKADEPSVEAITAVPLALGDRCCACPSQRTQAFVRVVLSLPDGGSTDLLFCGHHYSQHETALAALPSFMSVQDERHRINEKPTS